MLKRQIHIRRSSDLFDRLENAKTIIKFLHNQSLSAPFVKPFLYLLQSYMELLCARKLRCQSILVKARKFASSQENKLVQAWIEQNKRTWEESNYNSMAQYWVEHVGGMDGIRWEEIHSFSVSAWSTILYPFPPPYSSF